jgi:monofunctional chorismate mutase
MLNELRKEIDEIDELIIQLLDDRIEIVHEIGDYKKDNNIDVLDSTREALIFEKIEKMDLENKDTIIKIYEQLMNVTKDVQR